MAMNGRVDFPKKKLAHQWPGSALGRPEEQRRVTMGSSPSPRSPSPVPFCWLVLHSPGEWGTASPGYSALPLELLLDQEPRRPGKGRRVSHRALGQPWAGLARGYLRR